MEGASKFYRQFFKNLTCGCVCYEIISSKSCESFEYQCSYVNSAFEKIIGMTSDSLIGKKATEIFSNAGQSGLDLVKCCDEAAQKGQECRFEYFSELLKKWYQVTVLSPDEGHLITIFNDVTHYKHAQMDTGFFFSMPMDLLGIAEFDGYLKKISAQWEQIFGWTQDELTAKPFVQFVHKDDREVMIKEFQKVIAEKKAVSVVNRFLCKDNTYRWLLWRFYGLKERNAVFVVAQDITERKQSEDTMQFTKFALDNLSDAAVWHGPDARFIYVNEAASFASGFSKAELLHMGIEDLVPGFEIEQFNKIWQELKEKKKTVFEAVVRTKDERIFPVEIMNNYIEFGGKEFNCAFVRDISERKRAEEEIKKSQKEWSAIFQAIGHPALILDENHEILAANLAVLKAVGRSEDEIIGKKCYEIFHASDTTGCPRDCPMNAMLQSGKMETVEMEMEALGRVFLVSCTPLLDENNQLRKIIHIATDITEKKKIEQEQRRLDAQIQQTQRLESLGILAGGIAHDFNNLLMAILGHAELALLELSQASPVRSPLEEIVKVSHRAAGLTRQMLAYSGKGPVVIQAIDLREVVTEMTHMLEVSISKKAVLQFHFTQELPLIQADPAQIFQIIMNLVINASEAIGDKNGIISISIGAMKCDRSYLAELLMSEELPEGQYVYLEAADTGCGMDKETITRIFDPFFTTKFTGRGLGLAAVLGIVRSHKGAIKVYSELGKGTSFKVLFPALSQFEKPVKEQSVLFKYFEKQYVVLLVDDEEAVRTVGRSILQRMGLQVLTAADGMEALETLKSNKERIACIILDLTMPNMDGIEALSQIRLIKPDLPVIMSSGYNEQDIKERLADENLTIFIQKPYQVKTLAEKLKKILS